MKIPDISSSRKSATQKPTATFTPGNSTTQTRFSAEVLQQYNLFNTYDRDIGELRLEIESIGESLEKEPTLNNFKKFRDVLSRLAKRIGNEAYRLEKCGGTPQNPRYYEIITTINIEADKLYKLIVNEQKNNMAITAKVIGIKGLVVDLIT